MTNLIDPKLLDVLNGMSFGFDKLFNNCRDSYPPKTNYPPYNIIEENEEYILELAVAGFGEPDLDIELIDGVLNISGETKSESQSDLEKYIHRGIANRKFIHSWTLNENVEIDKATLDHGILRVYLHVNIPEEQKPKKIKIHSSGLLPKT